MTERTCYKVVANKSGEVHSATTLEGAHAQRDREPSSSHTIYAVSGTDCNAKLTAEQLEERHNVPGTGVRWVGNWPASHPTTTPLPQRR